MKTEKSKFRIKLFSSIGDGLICTELKIARDKKGVYSIGVSLTKDENNGEPVTNCSYYQDNILAKNIDHFIASVAYTLVHEHLETQADITNILIRFDKVFKESNSIEDMIKNLASEGYQSDNVYLVTKEIDGVGRICYTHHFLKKPMFSTGNAIADRIVNEVYTELNEKLKTLKKETPTEEEKEYIIKVGGENETN